MKTFAFGLIDRFKKYSQTLDVQTVLCQKSWYVLNEDGQMEKLVFKPNGQVIVAVNGNAKTYTWEYLPSDNSILINHTDIDGTILCPAFMDNEILVLQKDGSQDCMFLLDAKTPDDKKILSLAAVESHLQAIEDAKIAKEQAAIADAEAEKKRFEEEAQDQKEKERIEKIKNEANQIYNHNYNPAKEHFPETEEYKTILKENRLLAHLHSPWFLLYGALIVTACDFIAYCEGADDTTIVLVGVFSTFIVLSVYAVSQETMEKLTEEPSKRYAHKIASAAREEYLKTHLPSSK